MFVIPSFLIVVSMSIVFVAWLMVHLVSGLIVLSIRLVALLPRAEVAIEREFIDDTKRSRRRVTTTAVLFLACLTVIPSQFAYIVSLLVQLGSCGFALNDSLITKSKGAKGWSRYHFQVTIWLLMFTCAPFTIPVLMAWIRNMSTFWFDPASSDHSLIAVAPITILVELLSNKMLPRSEKKEVAWVTYGIILIGAVYACLFCIRRAYAIYYVCNIIVVWFLGLILADMLSARAAASVNAHKKPKLCD